MPLSVAIPSARLLTCLDRWLETAAARQWTGPEPAALAWTTLVVRTGAILAGCKMQQLRHTRTAAAARAFALRPSLARWRALIELAEPDAHVRRLAVALEDTAFARTLLAHKENELSEVWDKVWMGLAATLPSQAGLCYLEALYLEVLKRHAATMRQAFGQFYTPPPLVDRMWRLGWAQWRAFGAMPSLLVDPCCGSGAFFRHPAAAPCHAPALPRLGFELQRLPRALARLHAWEAARDHEHILNADALTHSATAQGPRFVVGNPPWRNPSPALRDPSLARFLREELMPYAWRYEGNALSSVRGCNHGVREDTAFFLGRTLCWLAPRGVAVLVTSDSWLDAPTYTLLRRYLLDTTRVHTVLRLGRYFPGVRERAAVVVLSRGYATAGRHQTVGHADWSQGSADWVESQWETPPRPMRVDPHTCQLRPASSTAAMARRTGPRRHVADHDEVPSHVPMHALFTRSVAGAQSGCAPLFLAAERRTVEQRMTRLFANDLAGLAEELGPQVRGGAAQARSLLDRVAAARDAYGAQPGTTALRPIWAHFRASSGAAPKKQGWCYFDPRLWLFPRVPRQPVAQPCFWDVEPKLVFRDVYDPHDKPIAGIVDTAGWVCDNHVFNGGTRVVAVRDAAGGSLLSPLGASIRERFSSDIQFLEALARCFNSADAQQWGQAHPRRPMDVEVAGLHGEA